MVCNKKVQLKKNMQELYMQAKKYVAGHTFLPLN